MIWNPCPRHAPDGGAITRNRRSRAVGQTRMHQGDCLAERGAPDVNLSFRQIIEKFPHAVSMKTKICKYCEQEFQTSRFHPDQRACGAEECQRHRRADYHRQKLAADSEYEETCRNSQANWRRNNPDYMKKYRAVRREHGGAHRTPNIDS